MLTGHIDFEQNKVIINGKIHDIYYDMRGKRSKFWMGSGNEFLCKFVYVKDSFEDSGELLYHGIGAEINKKLGAKTPVVNSLQYTRVDFDDNSRGVICKNFLNSADIQEISGADMLLRYHEHLTKTNQVNNVYNTVDCYVKALKALHPNVGGLDKVKDDLLIMTLMDYVTFQTDRHASNLAFLFDKKNNTIDLAPIYDNSRIFNFTQTLVRFRECIEKLESNNYPEKNVMTLKVDKFCQRLPKLGVSTPTSMLEVREDNVLYEEMSKQNSLSITMAKELADEIKKSDKLSSVFNAFNEINMFEIVNKINNENDNCIPIECAKFADKVVESRLAKINHILKLEKKSDDFRQLANENEKQSNEKEARSTLGENKDEGMGRNA